MSIGDILIVVGSIAVASAIIERSISKLRDDVMNAKWDVINFTKASRDMQSARLSALEKRLKADEGDGK